MIPFLILLENALAVAAQLSLRRGAARFADQPLALSILLEPVRNPFILSGLLLHGMSFFLYIFILSKLRRSQDVPRLEDGWELPGIDIFRIDQHFSRREWHEGRIDV